MLEQEIQILEKQVELRERQETLLELQSSEIDRQIESYDVRGVKEVYTVEDQVNAHSVKTYREMQQSLEAVTFAIETTLKQLFRLSHDDTKPEEQLTKQLLAEFTDKVLSVRPVQLKQIVNDVVTQINANADLTMQELRDLLSQQTLLAGGNASDGCKVEIQDPAFNSEMLRLKEQLFLARKDLICAQILQQRWKDTLL